jgi:hypothetical protein
VSHTSIIAFLFMILYYSILLYVISLHKYNYSFITLLEQARKDIKLKPNSV